LASRRLSASALVLAAGLLLVACSSDEPPTGPPASTGQRGPSSPPEPEPTCVDGRRAESKKIDRPALAIKVENSVDARPQSGLERADLVYEEIVEGGITRFMAVFHCGRSTRTGPVRSARFDDAKLALPFTRLLAYSGSNSIVEKELEKRNVETFTEISAGDAFFRVPPGSTDIHSLYANTEKIRAQASKKAKPPAPAIFNFGDLNDRARKARKVTINFTPSNTIEYRWSKGSWRRWEAGKRFMVASGAQVGVPNLVIQEVRVDNSPKIVDPAGNPSPDIELTGKGRALLFRDGRVVKGTWRIKKEGRAPVFKTKSGDDFSFRPGPIWIELVPSRKGAVKGSFSFK
jgi:Protein of unknown function (DUF3048) N-terminal domain/Protein of unknown function (DUF3048) C-terminal domain